MNKKLLLLISTLLLIIVLVTGILFLLKPNRQTYTITLKESGFEPQNLTINQGDVVVFTSQQGKEFWPASDLHPTHGIYPEFDPQEPIETGKSWQFTFNKKGGWKYHDHLSPFFRGTISVE